jgi:hypothetical protein
MRLWALSDDGKSWKRGSFGDLSVVGVKGWSLDDW